MTTEGPTDNVVCAQDVLSRRSAKVTGSPSVSVTYQQQVTRDAFNAHDNPQGYVDLGMAENKVCEDLMLQKLHSLPRDTEVRDTLYYPDYQGTASFRRSLATFISREFNSVHAVNASQLVVQNGCESLLEGLCHALCDAGEWLMTSVPTYYRLITDAGERADVNIIEVPLYKTEDSATNPYKIDVDVLEQALLKAQEQGRVVKGLILVNPNNPLGSVCDRGELEALLGFCAKHELHVICDEIYSLCVHDPGVTFTSVLSLPHPDPARTHFLWGFSKDFGLSGYRCGVLWTANASLVEYMCALGVYHITPTLVQWRLTQLIDDTEWLHNVYLPEVKSRLRENYMLAKSTLERAGASVNPAAGGIFVWVDLTMFLPEQTVDATTRLFQQLMSGRVFVLPGHVCRGVVPGWVRVVTAVERRVLAEGLRRMTDVLSQISVTK